MSRIFILPAVPTRPAQMPRPLITGIWTMPLSDYRTVAVTGSNGFVMSVLIQRLLQQSDGARVLCLDIFPPDEMAMKLFAPFRERLSFHTADVRDLAALKALFAELKPEAIVHGASYTHVPAWEFTAPHPFIDVSVSGTLNVYEALRATGSVRKIVHVGSIASYGRPGPGTPEGLQDEDGPFYPDDYYSIGKYAGELVARRFAELHGIDLSVVRYSKVFGPMERPTGARKTMHVPFHLAAGVIHGRQVRMTRRTREAVGDWINVEDAADATLAALGGADAPGPYNVSTGRKIPVSELIALMPAPVVWVDQGEEADIDMDPTLRSGHYGAFSNERIGRDLGWQPRQLASQIAGYLEWAAQNPAVFDLR